MAKETIITSRKARIHAAATAALRSTLPFYLLIAFEMLYMAGPFAMYFYGVYNPILQFFNSSPVLSVLNSFFLPHIARTTNSLLINAHEHAGAFLAIIGFVTFLIGAVQIYYSKFTRKGAVTGGIYRFIRHPQYTSFAICGLGLLILWPRFINLFMFVTMLFVYYLLALAEERECARKFGASYLEYKKQTAMFLPLQKIKIPRILPTGRAKRALTLTALYLSALFASYGIGSFLYNHSLNSLYASYQENSATIAVCRMSSPEIANVMSIIANDRRTAEYINDADEASGANNVNNANDAHNTHNAHNINAVNDATSEKYLNYILPISWYAAEVPMNDSQYHSGHASPKDYDRTKYKVIITRATLRTPEAGGREIITQAISREPLAEIWIDLKKQSVTKIMRIPENYKYRGIPVALY